MPRTQTNDDSPQAYANAHRFWSITSVTSNQTLYSVLQANTNAVIVCMDIVHTGGASGDVCAIQIPSSGAWIFGGEVGAGIDDTFSWRGMIVLYPGESVRTTTVVGSWSASGSGYYQPFSEHAL